MQVNRRKALLSVLGAPAAAALGAATCLAAVPSNASEQSPIYDAAWLQGEITRLNAIIERFFSRFTQHDGIEVNATRRYICDELCGVPYIQVIRTSQCRASDYEAIAAAAENLLRDGMLIGIYLDVMRGIRDVTAAELYWRRRPKITIRPDDNSKWVRVVFDSCVACGVARQISPVEILKFAGTLAVHPEIA